MKKATIASFCLASYLSTPLAVAAQNSSSFNATLDGARSGTATAGAYPAKSSGGFADALEKYRTTSFLSASEHRYLEGHVEKSEPNPFIEGKVETVPAETKIDMVFPKGVTLNSELSQKGDEVVVRIAQDVTSGGKVVLPGKWFMRGHVTEAMNQKRLGRDGYVSVQFDKLVSPGGEYEVPFEAGFTTKDSTLKAVTKVVATDAAYTGVGAGAGALLGLQVSGIPATVAMNGYNIAAFAAAGAIWGLIASLKRKGKIRNVYEGDSIGFKTIGPMRLPAFDPTRIPSAAVVKPLAGLQMTASKVQWQTPPWGDKSASFLITNVEVTNNSDTNFYFSDLIVESSQGQRYAEHIGKQRKVAENLVPPGKSGVSKVVFLAGSRKLKYSLIFLSRGKTKELSRVVLN
jgi:hypothetical protein